MIPTARFLAAALTAGLLAVGAAAQDSKLKVQEGDKFPAVDLKAAQAEKVPGKKAGDTVSIADLKGKTAVIFFYPKALTPGCTVESCGFRDLADKFPKDVVLIGASADDLALQQKFIDTHKLPYALLADTDLKLIQALGIQSPRGKVPQRITFVVGKDGTIAKIYTKVDVKKHPEEVLKFVEGQK
jgi:peroxiredoxin Q/BCP